VHCTKISPKFEFGGQRSRSPVIKNEKVRHFSGAILEGASCIVRQFYAGGKISTCCLVAITTSFTNLSHHRLPPNLSTDSTDLTTGPFLPSISIFLFLVSSLLFCLVPCGRLSWLLVSFSAHYYYYYLKCTYLSDTVTLNTAGALYTVNGITENSAVVHVNIVHHIVSYGTITAGATTDLCDV